MFRLEQTYGYIKNKIVNYRLALTGDSDNKV